MTDPITENAGDPAADKGACRVLALGGWTSDGACVKALLQMFDGPVGLAFVLAKSVSPEALSGLASVSVVTASDGAVPEPGRLYVCPPGGEVLVGEAGLEVHADPSGGRAVADRLFESLAARAGAAAVGVLFGGDDEDGVAGCRAIQAAGGLVLAFAEEGAGGGEAAGGLQRLTPADLAARLSVIDNDADVPFGDARDAQAFQAILALSARESGVDMSCYKENSLRRQTFRRSRALGFANLDAYLAHLCTNPDEVVRLHQSFMISVSAFFRDAAVFDGLARALQTLIEAKRPGDALRVWVPACATGEEVYSIAMLLAEILGERLGSVDLRIFATDIDQDALDFARAGVYAATDLAGLSAERLARWFRPEGSGWRVDKGLRERCVFSLHDLTGHPPLVRMDLVSCRNLLIYFKPAQQVELLRSFHFALNPGGLLMLGKAESAGLDGGGFEPVDVAGKLYRSSALPVARPTRLARSAVQVKPVLPKLPPLRWREALVEQSRSAMLEAYGPPAVLVDAGFEPLHFFGASRRYFALPAGSADFSVFALCLPELRSELKTLCYRMRQQRADYLQGIGTLVRLGDQTLKVRPVLRRIESGGRDPQWALLIGFEESPAAVATPPAGATEALLPVEAAEEIGRLRQELADTREHLQAVITELEASNEELQCVNEELQSASEELQAANEELQASNEELTALNDELQLKSVEYAQLNTTLGNIQNSICTGLVVVDREGRVTRFNALAGRIFGLLPSDIGQFLDRVPCYLDLPRLREWVEGAVARDESRVEHVHQREFHYLMQIDAYRDEQGRNGGAVLTFTDISDLHRAEEAQARSEARFRQVWDSSLDGLAVVAADGRMVLVNPALERMFGYGPGELVGALAETLIPAPLRANHAVQRDLYRSEPAVAQSLMGRRNIHGCCKDGSELAIELGLASIAIDGREHVLVTVSDVTERSLAEALLRASERRLRLALDAARAGTWEWFIESNNHFWSDELWALYGLPHDGSMPSTETWWQTIDPDDLDRVVSTVMAARADGAAFETEWRVMLPPDAPPRWLLCRGQPAFDAQGRLTRFIGIVLDVSERRLGEERRRQSEEMLATILDNVAAHIYIKDRDYRYTYANREVCRLFGAEREDIVGRSDDAYFDAPTVAALRNSDRRVIEGGERVEIEETNGERGSGQLRSYLTIKLPLRRQDGSIYALCGISTDITERMRAEEQLRMLSTAVEQNPASIVLTDLDAHILYVNEAFERTSGYTLDEVRGRDPSFMYSGETSPEVFRQMWQVLGRGDVWRGEFSRRRRNGEVYVESAVVSPVRRMDGSISHYLGISRDITEEKRTEQELARHRHQLESLVEARTRELELAKDAAESASRAKSAFLANMSHEIRTPLNAVLGMAHIMRRDGVSPQQVDQLDKIDGAAQHLLGVINDILDLSKIEAEKFILDDGEFALDSVVSSVASMLYERASAKGLLLDVSTERLPCLVRGDATRFTQALLNLAGNAVKFTESGSVALRVRVGERREGRLLVRVEVCDSGIGISAEMLPKLFGAFEQGDASTTRRYGGTGLGLAITRRLAELMGGEAGATSIAGVGSTFWFTAWLGMGRPVEATLPLPVDAGSAEDILRREFTGMHVLLVEDEPINQEVAKLFLGDVGLDVAVAGNGVVAVDMLREGDFALILMDMQMPEMDGLEATRQIRRLPGRERVPIVAMTANAFAEDRIQCLAAGMDDFLSKPVEPEKLFSTILKWLRQGANGPS